METATEQLHEFLEHVVLENCLELFGVQDKLRCTWMRVCVDFGY